MILRANCKINLGLDILARRNDGFHEVATVMYPVRGLYDEVELHPIAHGVEFTSEGLEITCPVEKNLCVRACNLFRERYGVEGVHIHLRKRVPFEAGLGGGSSDATAVLMGLNSLFSLQLGVEELEACAAELGSDTAFFVRNTPQLCTGRGEVMRPVEVDLRGYTLVVVKPDEGVSTREAFAGVRPLQPEIPLAERIKRPLVEWQGVVTNAFEPHIFATHPAIATLWQRLRAAGARYASLSGSGSALFALFAEQQPKIDLPEGTFFHQEPIW